MKTINIIGDVIEFDRQAVARIVVGNSTLRADFTDQLLGNVAHIDTTAAAVFCSKILAEAAKHAVAGTILVTDLEKMLSLMLHEMGDK